jgi:tRNA dimethylallyltransferase
MGPPVILITGATACGKSAVALGLAERLGGVVINADSMQLYRELSVLTARPSPADEARAPHRLYGILSVAERGSVGRWLPLARTEIEAAVAAGRPAIVVGGTGLYFGALTEGLAAVPAIPEAVRAEARALLRRSGVAGIRAELAAIDPEMARRLHAGDWQRLLRAYEVMRATGRSLAYWQADPALEPPLGRPWQGYVLELPRGSLYRRIDRRFEAMLAAGALEEARALLTLGLEPSLPALRALGIPHLLRHLAGELDRASAVERAKQATRRYAKRQLTWQRNKMRSWNWLNAQETESFVDKIIPDMASFELTR